MTTSPRALSAVPLAVIAIVAALAAACSSGSTAGHDTNAVPAVPPASTSSVQPAVPPAPSTVAGATPTSAPASSSAPSSSAPSSAAPKAVTSVHVKLLNLDGSTYGVGMPVIALFSQRITDARAFEKATTATVDGKPIAVAWYFQNSNYEAGYPIEAHLRPQTYWPAHSAVSVDIPVSGLSAGSGLMFDDSLTSTWRTGAKTVSVVNNRTHTITVTSDDKTYGTFPVSLGENNATMRTFSGTKVIMQQEPTVCMQDTGDHYHDCGIKWDQRVTYTGEYLHAAPWNCSPSRGEGCTGPGNNIGHANSSNGCTNLTPSTAEKLYRFMRVGDVVKYPNADGPVLPMGDGYSDWNLSWTQWLTGGLLATT